MTHAVDHRPILKWSNMISFITAQEILYSTTCKCNCNLKLDLTRKFYYASLWLHLYVGLVDKMYVWQTEIAIEISKASNMTCRLPLNDRRPL